MSGLCAYAAFALIGLAATPTLGVPLSPEDATAAIAFSFVDEGAEEGKASGYAAHGWLYRRGYVEGTSPDGSRLSEQVLKVGWPFTVVRGFVRSRDGDPDHEGVAWASDLEADRPVRLLPVQPVWPGVVFYGILGALAFRARNRRTKTNTYVLSA